jgi:ParB/RepB/Spo0J family partition protein
MTQVGGEAGLANNTLGDMIVRVDPRSLSQNQFQVRVLSDTDPRVVAMVDSIRKNGLIEPPVLRRVEGGYQIATGHIRIRASIMLGMTSVECIVRQLTDEQMAIVVVEENMKHESLNPIEEGRGYKNMKDSFHWTEEQIASRFTTTRDVVAQRMRLLTFQEPLQQLIAEKKLDVSHAEAIATVPLPKQLELARTVIEKGLTVKDTTEMAKQLTEQENANKQVLQNIGTIVPGLDGRIKIIENRLANADQMVKDGTNEKYVSLEEMVMESHIDSVRLEGRVNALAAGGGWKRDNCTHFNGDVCEAWEHPEQIPYVFMRKSGSHYRVRVRFHTEVCATCPVFERSDKDRRTRFERIAVTREDLDSVLLKL